MSLTPTRRSMNIFHIYLLLTLKRCFKRPKLLMKLGPDCLIIYQSYLNYHLIKLIWVCGARQKEQRRRRGPYVSTSNIVTKQMLDTWRLDKERWSSPWPSMMTVRSWALTAPRLVLVRGAMTEDRRYSGLA